MADGHPDVTPLRREMQRRRLASRHTENPIEQKKIADTMGVHSTHVSRLESGQRSMHRLHGDHVWKLLRGYGFSPLEIQAAVERYGLNLPPQLMPDGDAQPPGMVMVMYEGAISDVDVCEPTLMHDKTEGRFDSEVLRVREVKPDDLLTEGARLVPVGAQLWINMDMDPDADQPAIVQQDGRRALCIWPITEPTYALPASNASNAPPLRLDPDRAEFFRRVVAISVTTL